MRSTDGPDEPGRLAVIVVNYGSHELIERNLGPVGFGDLNPLVVIVDNFCDEAEAAAVAALADRMQWSLISSPTNGGFGAGMNLGLHAARAAGCTTFLLVNPDAVITAEVTEALYAHSVQEPLSLTAPRIVDSVGGLYFQGSSLDLRSGRIRGHRVAAGATLPASVLSAGFDWVTGACVIFSAELLDRVRGFTDPYFLYWEDVDLSYRVVQAGGRVLVRQDLTVVHDEGGTQVASGQRAKSGTYYYYNCRNRLLFAAQHLPPRDLARWILLTPAVSWEILMRGGRRQLIKSPKPLLSAVRGSAAGLRIAIGALLNPKRPR